MCYKKCTFFSGYHFRFSSYNLLFLFTYFSGAEKYFKGAGIEVYSLFYFLIL